jgi:predicted pyridoxine 5'-phosphate oxidase superfamily flavin-nucleotide-binding protein
MERRSVEEEAAASVLCWVATVSPDGTPNVSPKEVFAALDADTLVVADIASPVTVRNLHANGRACVSFIDVFRQTGFKLTGRAEVVAPDDPRFEALAQPLLAITQGRFPIRHVLHLRAEAKARIVAPSYRLFPATTVEERVADAMETYGVRPPHGAPTG